jgi:endonuclease I
MMQYQQKPPEHFERADSSFISDRQGQSNEYVSRKGEKTAVEHHEETLIGNIQN